MVYHRTGERSGRVVESSRFRHLPISIDIIQNEITTLNSKLRSLFINLPQPILTWSLELSSSTIESGSGSIDPSIHSAIWIYNNFHIYPVSFVFQDTINFEIIKSNFNHICHCSPDPYSLLSLSDMSSNEFTSIVSCAFSSSICWFVTLQRESNIILFHRHSALLRFFAQALLGEYSLPTILIHHPLFGAVVAWAKFRRNSRHSCFTNLSKANQLSFYVWTSAAASKIKFVSDPTPPHLPYSLPYLSALLIFLHVSSKMSVWRKWAYLKMW